MGLFDRLSGAKKQVALSPKAALALAAMTVIGADGAVDEEEISGLQRLVRGDSDAFQQAYETYKRLDVVEAAGAFRPDVVLLDIGLPRLNGYDACRRIREQSWSKKMFIVALTGWGQDEDRQKASDAGFNGHIVKPVEQDTLDTLLARLDGASTNVSRDESGHA